jgi:hypothetical protein
VARQQKLPHVGFLQLTLADEVSRCGPGGWLSAVVIAPLWFSVKWRL